MSSLAQRILTALVLIPVVIWLVLYSADSFFTMFLAAIVFLGGHEWVALSGVSNKPNKIFLAVVFVLLPVAVYLLELLPVNLLMSVMVFFWVGVVLSILICPNQLLKVKTPQVLHIILGLLLMGTTALALFHLRVGMENGPSLLMYLLLLIWIADSGAYFAGRAFGKHKLAPVISPGKSIEGVLGGLLLSAIFVFFAAEYTGYTNSVLFLVMSIIVALVSVYGDLFESLLKRRAGVKDSGALLPGHGGVLDRLDSLIAAAPFFVGSLALLGEQL